MHSLDVPGPYEVCAAAGAYRDQIAVLGGRFTAWSGPELCADDALGDLRARLDTLIVAAGDETFAIIEKPLRQTEFLSAATL